TLTSYSSSGRAASSVMLTVLPVPVGCGDGVAGHERDGSEIVVADGGRRVGGVGRSVRRGRVVRARRLGAGGPVHLGADTPVGDAAGSFGWAAMVHGRRGRCRGSGTSRARGRGVRCVRVPVASCRGGGRAGHRRGGRRPRGNSQQHLLSPLVGRGGGGGHAAGSGGW